MVKTLFRVLMDADYLLLDPPVMGIPTFSGNKFNDAKVPPTIINFPSDFTVKVCFKSGFHPQITKKISIIRTT
jgi:hypothetical protein